MQLTITAIGGNVAIPDPFPTEGAFQVGAAAGNSATFNISQGQLNRITPQLTAMETIVIPQPAGAPSIPLMTWSVSEGSSDDNRSGLAGLSGAPALTALHAVSLAAAGGTGVVAYGANLLANQVKAANTIVGLVCTAIVPGSAGNKITVAVTAPSGTHALTVSVTGTAVTIALDVSSGVPVGAGNTQTLIAAAVAASSAAAALIVVTGGATQITTTAPATYLANGQGPGLTLTADVDVCTITAVTASQITFNNPAASRVVATDVARLSLYAGTTGSSLSVPMS